MSVYRPYQVRCSKAHTFEVNLLESLNLDRTPHARQAILDGTFHTFQCPECKDSVRVEHELMYLDRDRDTLYSVKPPSERHNWLAASRALQASAHDTKRVVPETADRTLRVVYGLPALREKLIAQDAGIDDRDVELLKVLVVYEHPFLIQRPRFRLLLDQVTPEELVFVAIFDHSDQRFEIRLPREVADPMIEGGQLRAWAERVGGGSNLYDLSEHGDGPDHWVDMWRWSPQVWALRHLSTFAGQVEAEEDLDFESREWQIMVEHLPRGSHLAATAKRELRVVYLHVKQRLRPDLEDALFEIRFGIRLEDDWAKNDDPHDIATLWNLLRDLPDSNVEGNSSIREILLDENKGGGWYSPRTHDIAIGGRLVGTGERFEDVVRHEVGHAVNEEFQPLVDEWLADRFGWVVLPCTVQGTNTWIDLMGGWNGLEHSHQRDVVRLLKQALGPQDWSDPNWYPGPEPNPHEDHPWWNDGFGPRLAYERSQSGNWWWENNQAWHQIGDRAFALNYYYKELMSVNVETIGIISRMPDSYAAMSPAEFFAELYAVLFDVDDPERLQLPEDVVEWLYENIGRPE